MKMSIRGVVFGLVSHRATKELGAGSRKGIALDLLAQIAQNELSISQENVQKALKWLNDEGYIKLTSKSIIIRKAGWELSERYIKALKKWYKLRKTKVA